MEYNHTNLLLLFNNGLSYSKIAAKLGVSKGVISGKLNRLKKKENSQFTDRKKLKIRSIQNTPATQSNQLRPKMFAQRTVFVRSCSKELSKSELRDILTKAVVNTK